MNLKKIKESLFFKNKYKYRPKTKEELIRAIKKEIYEIQGTPDNPNWEADLNCIDTSKITDMSGLFSGLYELNKFNGDISKWNVSNVRDMNNMFAYSKFNNPLNNWDVSNVRDMSGMFKNSSFNQDISNWNISNVNNMSWMFAGSKFNKPLNNWNVSNVIDMYGMFYESKFNQPLNNWDVSNVNDMFNMFAHSEFNQNILNWEINGCCNTENMFHNSRFNQDIGSWKYLNKRDMGLRNISVSIDFFSKLPDKIITDETVNNIEEYINIFLKRKIKEKLIYEIQVIDKLDNKYLNKFTEIFQNDLKEYLKQQKEKYKNKPSKIISKLLLKEVLDIIKHTKNQKIINLILNQKKVINQFNLKDFSN